MDVRDQFSETALSISWMHRACILTHRIYTAAHGKITHLRLKWWFWQQPLGSRRRNGVKAKRAICSLDKTFCYITSAACRGLRACMKNSASAHRDRSGSVVQSTALTWSVLPSDWFEGVDEFSSQFSININVIVWQMTHEQIFVRRVFSLV